MAAPWWKSYWLPYKGSGIVDFSWHAMAAAIRVVLMVSRTAMAEDDLVGSCDLI